MLMQACAGAFAGAFAGAMWAERALPLVHCYAFLRDNETDADLRKVRSLRLCCAALPTLSLTSGLRAAARRGLSGRARL